MAYSDESILNSKNNAQDKKLDASINPSVLSIVLKAGEGSAFPITFNGSATSLGSSTVLNSTGIGASGVVVGDFIRNITDGSIAVITVVNTNDVTTTMLKGGTDQTWESSDKWAVNSFAVTVSKKDSNSVITAFENILIDSRSGDTLTINANGRGFAGTSAQSFAADDFCELFSNAEIVNGIQEAVSEIFRNKVETNEGIQRDGSVVMIANLDLGINKIVNLVDPTSDQDGATKKYVDDSAGAGVVGYAGESLTKGDATRVQVLSSFAGANTSLDFGRIGGGGLSSRAIRFIGNGIQSSDIKVGLFKTGTPTDNVVIRIETDNAGVPSGTLFDANAVATIAGASLTGTIADTLATFTASITPLDGIPYWITFSRSGALDNSNYYRLGANSTIALTSDDYQTLYTEDGGGWLQTIQTPYADFLSFAILFQKADAAISERSKVAGFVPVAKSEGVSMELATDRAVGGLSFGAETSVKQFLSDTRGQISTSAGTVTVEVGRNIDQQTLQILLQP